MRLFLIVVAVVLIAGAFAAGRYFPAHKKVEVDHELRARYVVLVQEYRNATSASSLSTEEATRAGTKVFSANEKFVRAVDRFSRARQDGRSPLYLEPYSRQFLSECLAESATHLEAGLISKVALRDSMAAHLKADELLGFQSELLAELTDLPISPLTFAPVP